MGCRTGWAVWSAADQHCGRRSGTRHYVQSARSARIRARACYPDTSRLPGPNAGHAHPELRGPTIICAQLGNEIAAPATRLTIYVRSRKVQVRGFTWTEPLVSGQQRLPPGGILLRVLPRRTRGRRMATSGLTYLTIAASRSCRWETLRRSMAISRRITVHSPGANR